MRMYVSVAERTKKKLEMYTHPSGVMWTLTKKGLWSVHTDLGVKCPRKRLVICAYRSWGWIPEEKAYDLYIQIFELNGHDKKAYDMNVHIWGWMGMIKNRWSRQIGLELDVREKAHDLYVQIWNKVTCAYEHSHGVCAWSRLVGWKSRAAFASWHRLQAMSLHHWKINKSFCTQPQPNCQNGTHRSLWHLLGVDSFPPILKYDGGRQPRRGRTIKKEHARDQEIPTKCIENLEPCRPGSMVRFRIGCRGSASYMDMHRRECFRANILKVLTVSVCRPSFIVLSGYLGFWLGEEGREAAVSARSWESVSQEIDGCSFFFYGGGSGA